MKSKSSILGLQLQKNSFILPFPFFRLTLTAWLPLPTSLRNNAPKMENPKTVDQHPAIALIAARPDLFAHQGSVSPTWRRRNGRVFGPYYRLSYRDDGRQSALYLGREGPLVQRVRHLLQKAQNPLRQKRIFDRIERETRAALRTNNARLAVLLRPLGLRLKGHEVRGWRNSLLRIPPSIHSAHLGTQQRGQSTFLWQYEVGCADAG